jgi:hypothetical protein
MLAPAFLKALDEDQDRVLTREEVTSGFARLFDTWGGKAGALSAEQLRAGIERDFAVPMPGPGMRPPLEE